MAADAWASGAGLSLLAGLPFCFRLVFASHILAVRERGAVGAESAGYGSLLAVVFVLSSPPQNDDRSNAS
jgi:hypothetical protein